MFMFSSDAFVLSHARNLMTIFEYIFQITELNVYNLSLLITTHDTYDIADANSMQDIIYEPRLWPGSPRVSLISLVRAFDWFAEGHSFDSCRGFFSLSYPHNIDILCLF